MADYNANLILGGQAPQFENPVDIESKAMQLKSLANKSQMEGMQLEQEQNKFNDEKALRTAMDQNTHVDRLTGKVQRDDNEVLKALASNPQTAHLAIKTAQQFEADKLAKQTSVIKQKQEMSEYGGQVIGSVLARPNDQKAYDEAKANFESIQPGSTEKWPAQRDDDFLNAQFKGSMKAKDQAEIDLRKIDVENHKKQLEMDSYKAFGAPNPVQQDMKPGELSKEDPAMLVKRLPQHLQAKAYEVLEVAQNTAKTANQILEEFDKAAAERRSISGMVKGVHAKAFHALMGPTFKDVEGTVRQAAMDNMNKNVTPDKIDTDSDVAVRRKALKGYLLSKKEAPLLKGYGIDLSKYESTNIDPKILEGPNKNKSSDPHPHDEKAIEWAKSNPGDPRSAEILKRNGM